MLYKYRRGFALSALLFIALTLCAPFGAVWADGYSPHYNPTPHAVKGTYNINPTVDPKQYQYKAPSKSVQPKLPAPKPPAELKYKDPLSWDYFKYVAKNLVLGSFTFSDKSRVKLQEYRTDLEKYPTRSDYMKAWRQDRLKRMYKSIDGYFYKNVAISGLGLLIPNHYDGLDQNGNPKYRTSQASTALDVYTGIVNGKQAYDNYTRMNEIQRLSQEAKKGSLVKYVGEGAKYGSEGSKLVGGPAGKILARANPVLAGIGAGFF